MGHSGNVMRMAIESTGYVRGSTTHQDRYPRCEEEIKKGSPIITREKRQLGDSVHECLFLRVRFI